MNEVLTEVSLIKDRQEDIDGKLDTMKNENEALWREVDNQWWIITIFEILVIAMIVITNASFYWNIGNKRFLVGVESAPEAHAAAKNSEQADPVPRCARSA